MMQAYVQRRYGPPEVLKLRELDRPVPGDDQVLVRVRASSVNPADWVFLTGIPRIARVASGPSGPRALNPGHDLAGRVESAGRRVTAHRPGDEVFGEAAGGAWAQYVCLREGDIERRPANVTFEQAAAIPVAGVAALQGLRAGAGLEPGQRVLINGASGGVGTFAVQIARARGAMVTGICHTRNVAMVRALGAVQVIDYTRQDFPRTGQYDLVLDLVGNRSLADCRAALAPGGTCVFYGSSRSGAWLGPVPRMLAMVAASLAGTRKLVPLMAKPDRRDLAQLRDLVEAGQVTPVISRRWPFDHLPEALRTEGISHARGKTVISI